MSALRGKANSRERNRDWRISLKFSHENLGATRCRILSRIEGLPLLARLEIPPQMDSYFAKGSYVSASDAPPGFVSVPFPAKHPTMFRDFEGVGEVALSKQ